MPRYTPETPFQSTYDCGMVYSLKQDGWDKGNATHDGRGTRTVDEVVGTGQEE